jgi:crotonobetainyl-CoA:carnitine CoA-transferase CaiB-like acyl-CoA transferase
VEEWNAYFLGWMLERTKREVWAEARRAKLLCGPLFSVEDMFTDSHFRDRGFWSSIDHPDLGKVEVPGRPFMMGKGGWELRRPAPRLGQHTEEVLREAGVAEPVISEVLAAEMVR